MGGFSRLIGPAIGGFLSEPAQKFGGVFDNALFRGSLRFLHRSRIPAPLPLLPLVLLRLLPLPVLLTSDCCLGATFLLFAAWPFALPILVGTTGLGIGWVCTYLFLPETLSPAPAPVLHRGHAAHPSVPHVWPECAGAYLGDGHRQHHLRKP